jgi:hypothetical protein
MIALIRPGRPFGFARSTISNCLPSPTKLLRLPPATPSSVRTGWGRDNRHSCILLNLCAAIREDLQGRRLIFRVRSAQEEQRHSKRRERAWNRLSDVPPYSPRPPSLRSGQIPLDDSDQPWQHRSASVASLRAPDRFPPGMVIAFPPESLIAFQRNHQPAASNCNLSPL